jgi:hypothetical protein
MAGNLSVSRVDIVHQMRRADSGRNKNHAREKENGQNSALFYHAMLSFRFLKELKPVLYPGSHVSSGRAELITKSLGRTGSMTAQRVSGRRRAWWKGCPTVPPLSRRHSDRLSVTTHYTGGLSFPRGMPVSDSKQYVDF